MAIVSYNKIEINTSTKIISIIEVPIGSPNGQIDINVAVDLYSDLKEAWQANVVLRTMRLPMRSVGGDPLPVDSLGATYFLNSEWKIRVYNGDHRLVVTGNLYSEDGTSVFLPSIDPHNVFVESTVSNIVDRVSVGGGGNVGAQVWGAAVTDYTDPGSFGEALITNDVVVNTTSGSAGQAWPIGTYGTPSNNISDAIAIATKRKVSKLVFLSDVTLNSNMIGYELIGAGYNTTLTLGGFDISSSTFRNIEVTGTMAGAATFYDCNIINVTNFNGTAHRCGLDGTITPATNASINYHQCYSTVEGTVTINFTNGAPNNINNTSFDGIINIINMTDAGIDTGIGSDGGHVVVDNSNTDGTLTLRGTGILTDNSAGATIINEMVSNSSVADKVWDETRTDHLTVGSTGEALSNILADTTQLRLDVIDIETLVTTLLKYESNRTEIDKTAKTLTVYDDNGTTPLQVFDLFDSTGTPSVDEVTERVPQ
jgi:hypothetical protein